MIAIPGSKLVTLVLAAGGSSRPEEIRDISSTKHPLSLSVSPRIGPSHQHGWIYKEKLKKGHLTPKVRHESCLFKSLFSNGGEGEWARGAGRFHSASFIRWLPCEPCCN